MGFEINNLKEKLSKGHFALGSAVFSWSPNMAEMAGYSGLDFIRIDTEHAWRKGSEIENIIRAAHLTKVLPIVRIDGNDSNLPRKAFEIGAGGIIATEINSVDDAKSLVDNAKFPPVGIRGYSGNCWSGGWGKRAGPNWVEWSNRELLVGIMVECPRAIDQVEEILAVDGIDFALFGPADFSMSLGLGKPSKNHPRVQDALNKTITAARNNGKHVMYNPGVSKEQIQEAIDIGITMIEVGNDLGIAGQVWESSVKMFSKEQKETN